MFFNYLIFSLQKYNNFYTKITNIKLKNLKYTTLYIFRGLMAAAQYTVPFSRFSNAPLFVPAPTLCSLPSVSVRAGNKSLTYYIIKKLLRS